jgi:hypothetical protein
MRSFLGFVLLVALLLGVFAFAVLPLAGPGLVSAVIRGTPPLAGQKVTVSTNVDAQALLRGEITRIAVTGASVGSGSVRASGLTLTIDGLSVLDRSFANLDGQAASVVLDQPDATIVELHDLSVSGNSRILDAVGLIPAEEVVRLLTVRLAVAGRPVDAIRLESGAIVITLAGQEIPSRLAITDGAVYLTPDGGFPPVAVSAAVPAPWRLVGLDVAPAGITVRAQLSGARLG